MVTFASSILNYAIQYDVPIMQSVTSSSQISYSNFTTTLAVTTTAAGNSSNSGVFSIGVIIGIVVAIIAVVLAVVIYCFFYSRHRDNRNSYSNNNDAEEKQPQIVLNTTAMFAHSNHLVSADHNRGDDDNIL